MQIINVYILLAAFSLLSPSCTKKLAAAQDTVTVTDTVQMVYPLVPLIKEISGICDSKTQQGFLWGEEDSGNPPLMYLIGHDGNVKSKVFIAGAVNTDWEDIALVDGSIYMADIGDNNAVRSSLTIYKFPEPVAGADTVKNFDAIHFTYADGPHDAEAILIDSSTKDIYVITKRDTASRIYRVHYPYSHTSMNTAEYIASLPYNGVVSAAVSPDGTGIIVKNYFSLYYYKRPSGTSIPTALQQSYTALKYTVEPQGEAVTFALDNSGYYTVSEKGNASKVDLNFYKVK